MKNSSQNLLRLIASGKVKSPEHLRLLTSPPVFHEVVVCYKHKKVFDLETGSPLDYGEFEKELNAGQVVDFCDNHDPEKCFCDLKSYTP